MSRIAKTFALVLLTVFFIVILSFALYALTDLFDSELFVSALIFQSVGYMVLLLLSALGTKLSEKIGTPMLISLAVITVLYVLATYTVSAVTYRFISVNVYVLIGLVISFVYFGISTVIVLTGISHIKSLSSRRNS